MSQTHAIGLTSESPRRATNRRGDNTVGRQRRRHSGSTVSRSSQERATGAAVAILMRIYTQLVEIGVTDAPATFIGLGPPRVRALIAPWSYRGERCSSVLFGPKGLRHMAFCRSRAHRGRIRIRIKEDPSLLLPVGVVINSVRFPLLGGRDVRTPSVCIRGCQIIISNSPKLYKIGHLPVWVL